MGRIGPSSLSTAVVRLQLDPSNGDVLLISHYRGRMSPGHLPSHHSETRDSHNTKEIVRLPHSAYMQRSTISEISIVIILAPPALRARLGRLHIPSRDGSSPAVTLPRTARYRCTGLTSSNSEPSVLHAWACPRSERSVSFLSSSFPVALCENTRSSCAHQAFKPTCFELAAGVSTPCRLVAVAGANDNAS